VRHKKQERNLSTYLFTEKITPLSVAKIIRRRRKSKKKHKEREKNQERKKEKERRKQIK
jgi:hypothetical protein